MDTILDLDLDFFVWPIENYQEGENRLPEAEYSHSPPNEVRTFLEEQCSLNRREKIPGHEMVEHEDAFYTWRRWLDEGLLTAPFDVIHVDAHADLGQGQGTWVYLLTEFLALPLVQRREPPRGANHGLNSGNYLTFAIANRWIRSLKYVFPHFDLSKQQQTEEPVNLNVFVGEQLSHTVSLGVTEFPREPQPTDLMHMVFRDWNAGTGLIELGRHSPQIVGKLWEIRNKPPAPIEVEPAVPFTSTPKDKFRFSGFTHMTVAQSPLFTPASADQLLPIFRDYFAEV